MSTLIPNSFPTPNLYIDKYMSLLTPTEFKVLIYAVRRIFGSQDRISLSQFHYGTDLSRSTIVVALEGLVKYGLLIRVDMPTETETAIYELQFDDNLIDHNGLANRQQV